MSERDEALERATELLDGWYERGLHTLGDIGDDDFARALREFARAEVVRELQSAADLIDMDSPCAWLRARAAEIEKGET